MATVTARGEAVVRTAPDEATLALVVTALEPDPAAALADVTARSGELSRLLDELAIAEGARTTTGVSVSEEFDHTRSGRRSLGHRAAAGLSVRLTDPELIGRLIAQATGRAGARVDGPHWSVDPANPAHAEAARLAAADARRRAEAYAEGVGLRLGAVRRIRPSDGRMITPAGGWRAAALEGRDDISVEAGAQEISASVAITFALEEA
jgi:uncharacterized protein